MLAVISYPPIPIWEVGPLRLSLHGLFAALGFLAGAWIATRMAEKRGYDTEKYQSILIWGLVGAMLGARYFTTPATLFEDGFSWEALHPLMGNFSILGGFAGGIIGGVIRTRMLGFDFLPFGDVSAFGLALGTVVGRLGDVAIVEHLGAEYDGFLAYGLKKGYRPAPVHTSLQVACEASDTPVGEVCAAYHPTGLYDLLGALLLLGVLFVLARTWKQRHYGQLFGFWVVWYGIQRFFIEFTRLVPEDQAGASSADKTLGPLTWSSWSSIAAAALGIALILWWGRSQPVVSDEADAAFVAAAQPEDVDA